MDTTTMTQTAPIQTRRARSVRPDTAFRLLAPVGVDHEGMTLPYGKVAAPWSVTSAPLGALVGAAMTHPSIDDSSFRRGRPPV